jgi:FKBP12-rapamycin complex-associated protein
MLDWRARGRADLYQGPETLRETSFVQSFGHDLRLAREHLRRYTLNGDAGEIQQAWDVYYSVSPIYDYITYAEIVLQIFQRLGKQLKLLNIIELQYVSPKLMAVRDLDIAVPGTYQSGKPVVGIAFVMQTFQVITSKQRPRKCSMRGRDGKEYTFCLKGQLSVPSGVIEPKLIRIRPRGSATR